MAMIAQTCDNCQHTPPCNTKEWLEFTVSNYQNYFDAARWLREDRNQLVVFARHTNDHVGMPTERFTFRFLCKQEYVLFVLRWS